MNKIVLFGLILVSLVVADEYTDRYDDINVQEILGNKRLLSSYVKCLLDQGRCTPEGKELKVHIKDGLQTGCSKCTEKQKVKAKEVIGYIREKEEQYWNNIINKYDPQDEYKEVYEAFLKSEN